MIIYRLLLVHMMYAPFKNKAGLTFYWIVDINPSSWLLVCKTFSDILSARCLEGDFFTDCL